MLSRFRWTTFDVNDLLPRGWQQEVHSLAADAEFRLFPRTPVVSREAADVSQISRGRVHADQVRRRLPWLDELYRGAFLDLAREAWMEPVVTARDARYRVVLNVQRGTSMRFECHVDSNPLTGLLFFTDHRAGGELVIGNNPIASSLAEIERDCSVIRPHAGHLVFFDARHHPHYARPLASKSDTRVLADMNFYTESDPESTRPRELNQHLYGDE
jgi:2OG-Fe(II) oxygenase superfamily